MNYIELFAGCGGLTLGLEASGYNLLIANELSPMASETFSYNFFGEELRSSNILEHTLWINSAYPKSNIPERLRENPRSKEKNFSDINSSTNLNKKLLVGSVIDLNNVLKSNNYLLNQIKDSYVDGGLDLVSGGPPCQSFSMAGLRQLNNDRNTLPLEFAKFVDLTNPKFVLLENVSGILKSFNTTSGAFYAWYEVAKAFSNINYIPLCLHVNAKNTGVAQNRPRFILIGIRRDVFSVIFNYVNETERIILNESFAFFKKSKNNPELEYGHLKFLDVDKDRVIFESSFLSPLVSYKNNFFTVKDAIGDLKKTHKIKKSKYVNYINEKFNILLNKDNNPELFNHNLRNHTNKVKKRFKIYQNLNLMESKCKNEIKKILSGKSNYIADEIFDLIKIFQFIDDDGKEIYFKNKSDFISYLEYVKTKKRTQKALYENKPAPAALSIPDDVCHYEELRTLTVREMARIQSFPDKFKFLSKITTGGDQRKFEVPQYTQVGNAVPPVLGYALGNSLKYLIDIYKRKINISLT